MSTRRALVLLAVLLLVSYAAPCRQVVEVAATPTQLPTSTRTPWRLARPLSQRNRHPCHADAIHHSNGELVES